MRHTPSCACGGKKGRSTRLRGPRTDPHRGGTRGRPLLHPSRHSAGDVVPLEEIGAGSSWTPAGARRRCSRASSAGYAATFAAWGQRKLWALLQADGYRVSMSSVARALARRGLLLPQRYQAERRQLERPINHLPCERP